MPEEGDVYSQIIEHIFFNYYSKKKTGFRFSRSEIAEAAEELGLPVPKNLGDVVYSFRHRKELPDSIQAKAPTGQEWIIQSVGRAEYQFALSWAARITPQEHLSRTKIPNATPGIIERYALTDEQAVLAKLRYNRLIDIFTGLACYSLQSHMRTTVHGSQVETDEIYIGIDKAGAHYVIPVQAKGKGEKLGIVQIEQDFGIAEEKFPDLIGLPVAAQLLDDNVIALFAFEKSGGRVSILAERHFELVPQEELSPEELEEYRKKASLKLD